MPDRRLPSEQLSFTDPDTGRRVIHHTAGAGASYPLYYFTPCVTDDGRRMVIHREIDGSVQLWRLDLDDGGFTRLTDAHTPDASWAIWCVPGVRGVGDHLSALNRRTGEAWYFDRTELRAVHIDALHDRLIADLADRVCISQNDFSPDGRWFAMLTADRASYARLAAEHDWAEHQAWRRKVPVRVELVDTRTGERRVVAELDFHAHHVLFLDEGRLILNHAPESMGMYEVRVADGACRALRPADDHGAACHQVITDNGIYYESICYQEGPSRNYLGRYDPATDTWAEFPIPYQGYVHTGLDPAGRLWFFEHSGESHELVVVHDPLDPARRRFETIRTLPPYPAPPQPKGQRHHAHPFLTPDRRWLIHTEVVDGTPQIAAVDVGDLTGAG